MSRTSSKSARALLAWSQPGLKVKVFFSNIPWNSPMVQVSFWDPGWDPSLFHTTQRPLILAPGPKLSQAQARSYIRCSPIQMV